jgi:hypothetical protein
MRWDRENRTSAPPAGVNPLMLMGAVTAFGLVSINQLLAMLRGHLSDRHAEAAREQISADVAQTKRTAESVNNRLNGELDKRITAAVVGVVDSKLTEVCGSVDDIRQEIHKMKHDIRGLHATYQMMEEMVEIASGRKAAKPPSRMPPDDPGGER